MRAAAAVPQSPPSTVAALGEGAFAQNDEEGPKVRPCALAFALCLLGACSEPRSLPGMAPRAPARRAHALTGYPPALAAQAEEAQVPLLLPPAEGLLEPTLVVEPAYWAFFAKLEGGAWVSIHASALAHAYPELTELPSTHAVRGGKGTALLNEGIWTVTFQDGGAAYALDLGCESHLDGRCADERAAIALADSLRPSARGAR